MGAAWGAHRKLNRRDDNRNYWLFMRKVNRVLYWR